MAATTATRMVHGICAGCRKPLKGDIVASRCNHVFHRGCLGNTCPKCHRTEASSQVLDVYGVVAGDAAEEGDADVTMLAAVEAARQRLAGTGRATSATAQSTVTLHLDSDDDDDGQPEVEEVLPTTARSSEAAGEAALDSDEVHSLAELLLLQQDVAKRGRELEESRLLRQRALDFQARQAAKAAEVLRAKTAAEERKNAKEEELTRRRRQHNDLLEQMQQIRQDDTSLEYYQMILKGQDSEAQAFLQRVVNFHSDPALLLVEIGRLRDHHRLQRGRWSRDAIKLERQNSQLKRDLEHRDRQLETLQRKVKRLTSVSSESLPSASH